MAVDFKPGHSPGGKALEVEKSARSGDGRDHTTAILLGTAAICIVVATVMRMTDSTPPHAAPTPPPQPPAVPEAGPTKLTDRELRETRWTDRPARMAEELKFVTIFYTLDPAFRRAQFTTGFFGEGATVGPDGEFTIERIDEEVVFLRDRDGKLHRLIKPDSYESSAKTYGWTGNNEPIPPARDSQPVDPDNPEDGPK